MFFLEYYESDMKRYCGGDHLKKQKLNRGGVTKDIKEFHYFLRKCQATKSKLLLLYYRFRLSKIKIKHGLEISWQTQIGKGLYIGHPYNITINPDAVLGENINIHKNVTIGQENRGERKGSPIIGNMVWIGIGATVVGKIKVGNDVLIAPGAFVNCDVPDHSIVIGNPCIIKHRENATECYVCNLYNDV